MQCTCHGPNDGRCFLATPVSGAGSVGIAEVGIAGAGPIPPRIGLADAPKFGRCFTAAPPPRGGVAWRLPPAVKLAAAPMPTGGCFSMGPVAPPGTGGSGLEPPRTGVEERGGVVARYDCSGGIEGSDLAPPRPFSGACSALAGAVSGEANCDSSESASRSRSPAGNGVAKHQQSAALPLV